MRTLCILIGCFAFVVLSCKSKDSSSSQGDPVKLIKTDLSKARSDSMNLSEIATRIEYIPLERADQSLIGIFMSLRLLMTTSLLSLRWIFSDDIATANL